MVVEPDDDKKKATKAKRGRKKVALESSLLGRPDSRDVRKRRERKKALESGVPQDAAALI